MELIALFLQIVDKRAAQAFHPERRPLVQNFADAERHRRAADEDVEIAGEIVLQRRKFEQPRHQLFAVAAALEVDGQLEAVEVGFVAHVGDFLDPAVFDQRDDDGLDFFQRGGVRNLRDLDAVGRLIVGILGAHLEAAAAGGIDFLELLAVVQQQAAGRKIGRLEDVEHLVAGDRFILNERRRHVADFAEVERADCARHPDGDARVGRHQHVGS